LCAILGFLQYRWIGEVTFAERGRLHGELQSELMRLSRGLDRLAELDSESALAPAVTALLAGYGLSDFDVQVVTNGPNPRLLYTTGPDRILADPDASAPVMGFHQGPGPGPGPGFGSDSRFDRRPPPDGSSLGGRRGGRRGPPPGGPDRSRWRILARHRNGSLEDLVAATQRRNLAVSGLILVLILGIAAMLMRVTRQAQLLADAHIGFLAGVSHELRTPLTVIRTAAFNLSSGKIGSRADQIERYGRLIADESGKLEALVDQVLRFAGGRAGHAIGARKPLALAPLIEDEANALQAAAERDGVRLIRQIEPNLPPALADRQSLGPAIRNLLDNALRYGRSGGEIRISAKPVTSRGVTEIEIEVADLGPGIPAAEIGRIFEPFFRGSRAVQDQIHGTGLGLNIVRTIAEAHGGSVAVTSEPGQGTHFFLRVQCAKNP
jgi:signal transduction histidine kinase